MRDIDKNDVDISQLFKWNKEVVIEDAFAGQRIKLYIRIVGDADLNRARAYGYRKAAELRKKLKTEGSDEQVSFLAELDDYKDEKDILVQTLILLNISDLQSNALNRIELPEPKEPKSDASQEAWEQYQDAIDSYPDNFRKELERLTLDEREKAEAELEDESMENLYEAYKQQIISKLCEEEMQIAYYNMCIFLGTYTDENFSTHAFKSFEEFENAHSGIKERLRSEYRSLELGTDFLKKLPEATE